MEYSVAIHFSWNVCYCVLWIELYWYHFLSIAAKFLLIVFLVQGHIILL